MDEKDKRRERAGRPAPNPLDGPGQRMTLSRLFEHIPPADPELMRDVDAAQSGRDLRS